MTFTKSQKTRNEWVQVKSCEVSRYLSTNQIKALGTLRDLAHRLCLTDSYRIRLFDTYVNDYLCSVIFEVRNMKNDTYIRKMRGQVFVNVDGVIYFYDKDDRRQEITSSLFPAVTKE